MGERLYNDSRYNSFELGMTVPSSRTSVKHTREKSHDPAGPRSFIPTNCTREPASFFQATEKFSHMWLLTPHFYRYHSCYGKKSYSFYFEPLAASRTPQNQQFQIISFINKRQHPISRIPIFRLPESCVDQILSYFSGSDLATLALIDTDCRQLARSRQYRSVLINYSEASMGLLEGLVDEACGRVREHSTGPRWTLGACIRRISIAFDSEMKRSRSEPTSWITSRRKNHKAVEYHQSHMNALELALQAALPNLDFLDWWDRIPITPIVTNSIMNSPITRLELHSITLSKDFDIYGNDRERRMTMQKQKWKLRRLVLSLSSYRSNGATMFTTSILKIAAPTWRS